VACVRGFNTLANAAGSDSSSSSADDLLHDPNSAFLGNPRGAVTVVEFFDYRCPYCRIMEPRLQELLAQDKSVRLVLKDWPIFGGMSVYAAQCAATAISSHGVAVRTGAECSRYVELGAIRICYAAAVSRTFRCCDQLIGSGDGAR
jgi:hypothetical protein